MSRRLTPETDAFLRDLNDYSDIELRAMTEHARKLERERDEARSEQSSIQCAFEDSQDKIEKLERERDEARAVANDLAAIASHCLGSHSFELNDTAIRIAAALKRWKKSQ
jgi:hypothetical protein